MKLGRKPKHAFNTLEIGEKALLTGSAKTYPYQFVNQFNKTKDAKLRIIKEGKRIFAERYA
jgi:hypothetical protein